MNEIELTLLELEVDTKSDYADPIMPDVESINATDLSNITASISDFTSKFMIIWAKPHKIDDFSYHQTLF